MIDPRAIALALGNLRDAERALREAGVINDTQSRILNIIHDSAYARGAVEFAKLPKFEGGR